MVPSALLPGFRFHPTDVELVVYYLKGKVMGRPSGDSVISEIDIYKSEPSDLPAQSRLKSKDLEWYFFCRRDRKYTNSNRTNRRTCKGYWKATGKDRPITHNSRTVGMKKTLIFHFGDAPGGVRTDWVMYEYRLDDKTLVNTKFSQDAYALCKIFQKSGPGPKNGEQYGAPFDEEEWEHDEPFENAICLPSVPSPEPPHVVSSEPVIQPEVGGDDDFGSWLAYLEGFLNTSPLHWEAEGETSVSLAVHKNGNEGMCNEFDEHFGQGGLGLANSDCISQDRANEYYVQPLMSELGDEHCMELNDFHFTEENSHYVSHNTVNEYAVQPLISEIDDEHYMEVNDCHCPEENSHYVSHNTVNESAVQSLISELGDEHYMEFNDCHCLEENSHYVSHNTVNGSAVQPLMSELGHEHYMELSDPQFIEENNPPEMIMRNHPFAFDSLYWDTNLQNMADAVDPTCNINSSTTMSDFLPHPRTFSDLSRLMQEVDESGSCSKQSDLNGCQLEDA